MSKRIALFIPSMRGGGAERVALSLSKGFLSQSYSVYILLVKEEGPLLKELPAAVEIINLNRKRTILSIFDLAVCMKKYKFDALISFMHYANIIAIISAKLALFNGKLMLTEHGSINASLVEQENFKRKVIFFLMKRLYKHANWVVGVSQEISKELEYYFKLKNATYIYNPVEIENKESVKVDDEIKSIKAKYDKVIMGVGRLSPQKNFEMLIRSFYAISDRVSAALIILGEGEERPKLEKLITDLGISDKIVLKGFVINPHAYLKHADVFVLSSLWEGFGLVVAEAMAHGVTVVSTDCPVGPSEILNQGTLGYLVPVNDLSQMSNAIIQALQNPCDPKLLKQRAADFSIEKVTRKYSAILFDNSN